MTSYLGAPEPFNASNNEWQLYVQRFEHFLLANKISHSDKKCHLLLALMGAPTFKLLANLAAPKQPGELKFKDICDIFEQTLFTSTDKDSRALLFLQPKVIIGRIGSRISRSAPKDGKYMYVVLAPSLTKPFVTDLFVVYEIRVCSVGF